RFRSSGKQDCVELALQIIHRNGVSDVSIGHEFHALGFYLIKTSVDYAFLHLEFRNAVTQQPTDAVGLFVNRYPVTRAIQLLRGSQSCRARADNRNLFSGTEFRRLRANETFLEASFDNTFFDLFDCDWRLVNPQHACRLTGRGANSARELG